MMRMIYALLLVVPAIVLADQPKPRFDGVPVTTTNFDDIPLENRKKAPFDDKRVRECILKHLDKAKTDSAVEVIVKVCRSEYGY